MTLPSQFFTEEYLLRREPDRPPAILFHFTTVEKALWNLQHGVLKGRPLLSTTENPALSGPGVIVFVLDSKCILEQGYRLWPYIYAHQSSSYHQEAEWAVGSSGSEFHPEENWVDSEVVNVPITCVLMVGYPESWEKRPSQKRQLEKVYGVLEELVIPFRRFAWEDFWVK